MSSPPLCARCGHNPVGYIGRECCYDCEPRKRKPLAWCQLCGRNPVAYTGRTSCYECVPRRRNTPWQCKVCGSDSGYFFRGTCWRCHRMAPLVDTCRDCLAWGVTRHEKWLCQACRGWHNRPATTTGKCPSCSRVVVLNQRGFCRLCCRQATIVNRRQPVHETLNVVAANRCGQQLFIADMILKKRGKQPAAPPSPAPGPVLWPVGYPVEHEQLALFAWPRNLSKDAVRSFEPPIGALAAALHQAVTDHGDRHGWSRAQRDGTWRGIRVLLAVQNTPGARLTVSEVNLLLEVDNATVHPVLEVLDSVGMLVDDRQPPLQAWFDNHAAELPAPMRRELTVWFHALRDGSPTPPRMRPRKIETVRTSVYSALTVAKGWAADGHESLREITRDDVTDALAATQHPSKTLGALRSLFRYLKASKLVFVNPTARLRGERVPPSEPLPIEIGPVRDALHSDDPARAAIAALIAFHALRNAQVRDLRLSDIYDGRIHVDGAPITMADPVRQRVNAWLAERSRRWPNTANPHLFISTRTAVRTSPVSAAWVIDTLGVTPRTIREDRILHEAVATGGDVRRLCDLFNISVGAAERYASVVNRPPEAAFDTTP